MQSLIAPTGPILTSEADSAAELDQRLGESMTVAEYLHFWLRPGRWGWIDGYLSVLQRSQPR